MAIREVVALFDYENEMLDSIDELEGKGFDRSEISIMPPMEDVEDALGHEVNDVFEAADDPNTPRIFHHDHASWGDAQGVLLAIPFLAGAFAVTIFGASNGLSLFSTIIMASITGLIGSLLGYVILYFLKQRHLKQVNDQVKRGGLAMWVQIRDNAHARRAIRIFNRHHAHDVRIKIDHHL